jgi:hypothetical protein
MIVILMLDNQQVLNSHPNSSQCNIQTTVNFLHAERRVRGAVTPTPYSIYANRLCYFVTIIT